MREVDSAETHSRDEDVDAIAERLVLERADGVGDGFRIVRKRPATFHFGVGFGDGHLERRVRHFEWNKFLPVLGTSQATGGFEAFVKRRGGERREQAEDGKTRRPGANFVESAIGDAGRVVVHAKMNEVMA